MVHGINNELQTIEPCPWCINLIVMPPNHNKMRPTTHPSHRLLPPPMLLATVIANVVYLYSYYCFFSFNARVGGLLVLGWLDAWWYTNAEWTLPPPHYNTCSTMLATWVTALNGHAWDITMSWNIRRDCLLKSKCDMYTYYACESCTNV